MVDHVFAAMESEFGITRPCNGQHEWTRLSEDRRIEYIHKIINELFGNQAATQRIFSPAARMTSKIKTKSSQMSVDETAGKIDTIL